MRVGATIILLLVVSLATASPTVYSVGVTIHDPAKAYQGLNLFIDASRDPALGQIVLMDMDGLDVQVWRSPISGYEARLLVEALPSGNIMVDLADSSGTAMIVEMDQLGNLVWQLNVPPAISLHHDFERLANGNTVVLASRPTTNLTIGPLPFADDVILEVDSAGLLVWDWSTSNHYSELPYTTAERSLIYAANAGGKANIYHSNAMSVLPPNPLEATDPRFAAGNILVSQRDTNLIFIVDRQTGAVVWTDRQAIGQHQPHMLSATGSILMLDNGGEAGYPTISRLWSQALEIDPQTAAVVWSYSATSGGLAPEQAFFGPMIGGAESLPNGNTLITEGTWGRAFEVTSGGEIVWEYVLPASTPMYRMSRIDAAWWAQ